MNHMKKYTPSIAEIFLSALLIISMLLLVDFEVAGMELPIFAFLVLTLLYVGYWILSIRRGEADIPQLKCRADVIVLILFGWNLLSIIGKLFQDPQKGAIDYRFQVMWIVLCILYFVFKGIRSFKDWYFDLILYAGLVVIAYMLFCYLCDMQMAERLPELMSDSGKTASYLLLPCMISVSRYCMCRDKIRSMFYLMTASVSFFTLFINHNIVSFWLMAIVFLAIPVLMRPTAELVKRDMQLFFVYLFMMSNMSLLVNYTELVQKELSFDLEHSVYLDLLLAVGGVFFFRYWDRIPEKADRERLVLRKMRRGYQFVLKLLGMIFFSFVLGGNRWKELPDSMGISMVKNFAVPLIDEIGTSRNAWIQCMEKSSISSLILLILTALIITRLRKNHSYAKPLTGSFLLIAMIFLMQLFFFAPSVNVLPVYLLMLVMASFYQEERQRAVVSKINLNKEIVEK